MLMLGDCLDRMQEIADGSVDAIIADLPYGTTACKWDHVIPFEPMWAQFKRVAKPNAAIVLTASQPFTSALVMSNPKMFRYDLAWRGSRSMVVPSIHGMAGRLTLTACGSARVTVEKRRMVMVCFISRLSTRCRLGAGGSC